MLLLGLRDVGERLAAELLGPGRGGDRAGGDVGATLVVVGVDPPLEAVDDHDLDLVAV